MRKIAVCFLAFVYCPAQYGRRGNVDSIMLLKKYNIEDMQKARF